MSTTPVRARHARPPLILVASDDEPAAVEIERVLGRHGYTVFRAHTGRLTLAAARSAQPDLIILDQVLPGATGFELCSALRDDPEVGPRTPLLLTTATAPTADTHRVALRAGVWEFLRQPWHPEELRARVDTYVLARAAQAGDPAQAEWDDESGLYSHAGLARRARELARQTFHHAGSLTCLMLAPARETDTLRVAHHLRRTGRRSDAIGRVGAHEFAIIAPGTDAREAVLMAERMAREINRTPPDGGAGPAPELRAGFDAVSDVRRTPASPAKLLDRAATALRTARGAGRGDWIRIYQGTPGDRTVADHA